MNETIIIVLAGLVVAFGVSYAITPATAKLARRFNILDLPSISAHKAHSTPTPYLGGIAIYSGLLAGSALVIFIEGSPAGGSVRHYAVGIGLAMLLGAVGLLDDVRHLSPLVRFTAEVVMAIAAWELGFRVQAAAWGPLNLVLTVIWIVGIANAFNLLDNMDGLTAGLAGVGALSFAGLGLLGNLPVLALVSAALAGAAFGFLGHNRPPAKVFMGDGGSLFLGFLLALVGIKLKFNNLITVTFLVPVVVLGLPIFDTTLVVLSRVRRGLSPFEGGRDHVSHRLRSIGLPVRAVVGLLYWCGLCLGWLGLVISRSNVQVGWMLLFFVVALGLFFGVLLWRVPLDIDRARASEERSRGS